MARPDVRWRLEYAHAAVAVLRALKITGRTMRYEELARAIGLIRDGEKWEVRHSTQISQTLKLVGATERQAGKRAGTAPIDFGVIVNQSGKPGAGFAKKSRIVSK